MIIKEQRYIIDKLSQIREAIWKLQKRFEDRRLYRNTDNWERNVGGYLYPTVITDVVRMGDSPVGRPPYSFILDFDTGIYRVGDDQLGFAAGGLQVVGIYNDAVANQILLTDGSDANASYSFIDDRDVGMYRIGADNIGFSTGGGLRMGIETTNIDVDVPIYAADGAVGAPSYSFDNDTDCGLYYSATQINVTIGGAQIAYINGTGVYANMLGVGVAPGTHNINSQYTVTNANGYYGIYSYLLANSTINGTYNNVACYFAGYANPSNAITDNGKLCGLQGIAYHVGGGYKRRIRGIQFNYGLSTTGAATKTAQEVTGIYMNPVVQEGATTALYDIYIGALTSGGTITNEYCIYAVHDAPSYFTGRIGIGALATTSEILNLSSTTAALRVPQMTTVQAAAIAALAAGMIVFDTTTNKFKGYDGAAWQNFH